MKQFKKLYEEIIHQEPINEEELINNISGFNTLGECLYKEDNEFSSSVKKISELAKKASRHIIESEQDWFSRVQLKKDAKVLENVARELDEVSTQMNELKQRSTALFEDCGHMLNRYYDIKECNKNKPELSKRQY